MATKFYSFPLSVDFPHSWFQVPEIFWRANRFLSNEETELCCPIHKWSSNIFWILVVVQVVRQSLLGHHRFAIEFIVINPSFFMYSYDFLLCIEWPSGIEGRVLLLWRRTALRLNWDDSIKIRQSRGLWLILSVCIRPSISGQAKRPLSILKNRTRSSYLLRYTEILTFSFITHRLGAQCWHMYPFPRNYFTH